MARRAILPALLGVLASLAASPADARPGLSDPSSARIELADAERFVALLRGSGATPTARALQRGYLAPGGKALRIFTPNRIRNAQHLAEAIARNPALYRDAAERCLPWVRATEPELRAVYRGFRALLPELPLPRVAVVFGAGNSGGTAGNGMQVLGLEVLCSLSPDEAAFRTLMRGFYAHETVHTFQRLDHRRLAADPLLSAVIAEGTADYLALRVTGAVPDPERARWAEAQGAAVWEAFARDLGRSRDPALTAAERAAVLQRWVGNADNPPAGWPSELGYWVGMQIAAAYVAQASDEGAAIRALLRFGDAQAVLAASGIILPEPASVPAPEG